MTSYRSFHVVNDHKQLLRSSKLYSVPGTSELHCIRSCGELFAMETQNLGFFFSNCLEDGRDCENSRFVSNWQCIFFTKTDEKKLVVRGAGWQVLKVTVLAFLTQTSQNSVCSLTTFLDKTLKLKPAASTTKRKKKTVAKRCVC